MFAMVANRKPGVPLLERWYLSPFNVIFSTEKLTKRGRIFRTCALVAASGFVLIVLALLAYGALSGKLRTGPP